MNQKQIERILKHYLEDNSLEDFFEYFNITPEEVVLLAYEAGLVEDYLLEDLLASDEVDND